MTLAATTVADRLQAMLEEHLCFDPERFAWDADLVDDLGADSLDTVELSISFDDEFNISIEDEAVYAWKTPGDMRQTIEGLVS